MRITKVLIKGWRSIKGIAFSPQDICLLLGPNNSGKTNILSAINFLLGDRYPMPGNLDDSDFFYGNRDRGVQIQLDFAGAPISRLSFDSRREKYNLQAFDSNGAQIFGFSNEQRGQIAFAYVDAARSYERQFGVSRFTLFGQAIRILHDNLRRVGQYDRIPKLRETLEQAHALLRSPLYEEFEANLKSAFASQLKTSRYDVSFDFRTIDETNIYRSLYPVLIERGEARSPSNVGSGIRNLLVLALFQAVAKTFRGGALLGIEEPELYLHPHAQRSLATEFEKLASDGSQLFISSHSAAFLDVTRSHRIVLVSCKEDYDGDFCTEVKTIDETTLLDARSRLHPERNITRDSLSAFLRNVRTAEMAEPFFARLVVIVEGQSEREALPLFSKHLGFDFDDNGISIVCSHGKTVIDTLVQLYEAHNIETYVIFDNDASKKASDRSYNKVLCRLLGIPETDLPKAVVTRHYAILHEDWETEVCNWTDLFESGPYAGLEREVREELGISGGKNKALIARGIAQRLISRGDTPFFVQEIVDHLKERLG